MEKYVVSRELAKKLKAVGYSQETAYHYSRHFYTAIQDWSEWELGEPEYGLAAEFIAAPLSDELLEQLPLEITVNNDRVSRSLIMSHIPNLQWRANYWSGLDLRDPLVPGKAFSLSSTTLPDALAELWLWCKKNGHLA